LIPFSYERGVSRPGPPGVTAGHLEYYSGVSYCLGGLVLAVVGDVPGVGKLLPRVALVLLSGFSFFCFVGMAVQSESVKRKRRGRSGIGGIQKSSKLYGAVEVNRSREMKKREVIQKATGPEDTKVLRSKEETRKKTKKEEERSRKKTRRKKEGDEYM
jgi:hypothetical protein